MWPESAAGWNCEQTPERELSTDVRHNLFLVVKEAINNTVNQDLRCQKHNLRHPEDPRELFTDGDGVEEALDIISSRILYMKTGQTS